MATITKPYTFTSGTTILSSEVNSNFDTLYSEINGALDDNNLANNAVGQNQIQDGSIVNAKINSSAAIAFSKLEALTANRAVRTNASTGVLEPSSVTNTELGYLSGVTSAIQTQLNSKVTNSFTASRAIVSDGSGNIAVSPVTSTEIGYLDGVTSSIQTQINGKQDTVSGVSDTEIGYLDGVTSSIQTQLNSKVTNSFTTGRALISNGSGNVAVSAVTSTEIGYLDGVTSAIQTQLNSKVPTGRTISAGTGLSGGGDLSANRTLSISNGGVNTTQLADNAVTQQKMGAAVGGFFLLSGDQTIAHLTYTTVDLDIANWSNGVTFSSADSTVTITQAGVYLVSFSGYMDAAGRINLQKNGADVGMAIVGASDTGENTYILNLAVNDVLRLRAFQTSGSDASLFDADNGTHLSLVRIGA